MNTSIAQLWFEAKAYFFSLYICFKINNRSFSTGARNLKKGKSQEDILNWRQKWVVPSPTHIISPYFLFLALLHLEMEGEKLFAFFFKKNILPLKMSSPSFHFSPNSILVQYLAIRRKKNGNFLEDFGEAGGQWVNNEQLWTRSHSSQTLPFRLCMWLSFQVLTFHIYKMMKWIFTFRVWQISLIQPLMHAVFAMVNTDALIGLPWKGVEWKPSMSSMSMNM